MLDVIKHVMYDNFSVRKTVHLQHQKNLYFPFSAVTVPKFLLKVEKTVLDLVLIV